MRAQNPGPLRQRGGAHLAGKGLVDLKHVHVVHVQAWTGSAFNQRLQRLLETMATSILPARFRAAGMAKAGPIPITSGGTPTTALALRTPRTGSPRASTAARRPISTAAAPSLTWLELPEHGDAGVTRSPRPQRPLPVLAPPPTSPPVLAPPPLTCRGAARRLEGWGELSQSLQAASWPDPVVLGNRQRALCPVFVQHPGGDGDDLLLEHT